MNQFFKQFKIRSNVGVNVGIVTSGLLPWIAFAQEKSATDLEALKTVMDVGSTSVAIVVPIAFFLFILGVVFIPYFIRLRQNRELQTTIRLMVEKGVQVPLEMIVPQKDTNRYFKDLRRGLILTSLGIVTPIASFFSNPGSRSWVWGLIPLAMGIAYLLSARLSKKP